jgi:hypothetical protein
MRKLLIFLLFIFLSHNAYADLNFSSPNSTIAINPTNSFLKLGNVNKVFGWSEASIVKAFGDNSPSQWVEGYTSGVVIAQTGGTAVPHTNLVYSNSNTINSLKPLVFANSSSIVYLSVTERTNSNAFAYEIKNNSNAIIKLGVTERTNSNAFAYGIKNNSNAIIKFEQSTSNTLVIQNSNAIVSWVKGTSNAVIKLSGTAPAVLPLNNSNAIVKLNAELLSIFGPGNTIINTPTFTMTYDYYLSPDHGLIFQTSCAFDGNGHMIFFAKNSPNILIINPGCNVVLTNVVLKNFDDSSVQLGSGATLTFGDGCRIDLADEQVMSMPWIFDGNSAINGCGNPLELNTQSIQIMQNGNLTINNLILEGLANNNLQCVGNANIILSSDTLQIASDYSFTSGALVFENDVVITGTNTFIYQTDQVSTITSASSLLVDSGITFSYAPGIADRDLIVMQDITSQLYLNGCTLSSTTTGLRLTVGTLTIDGSNTIKNDGAVSLSQGISFGNGISGDNLNINILPGGSINVVSGALDYQNQ